MSDDYVVASPVDEDGCAACPRCGTFTMDVADQSLLCSSCGWWQRVQNAVARSITVPWLEERVAYVVASPEDASEIGEALCLAGADVGVTCWLMPDGVWQYSLRSTTVDVAAVASKFGGGGHRGAAGFRSPLFVFEAPVRELGPFAVVWLEGWTGDAGYSRSGRRSAPRRSGCRPRWPRRFGCSPRSRRPFRGCSFRSRPLRTGSTGVAIGEPYLAGLRFRSLRHEAPRPPLEIVFERGKGWWGELANVAVTAWFGSLRKCNGAPFSPVSP